MTAAKPPAAPEGYRDGYIAGYSAGVVDGRGQGYSDAKYRAHSAIDAVTLPAHVERDVRRALVEIVGQQSS